jgi:hypothetical protein
VALPRLRRGETEAVKDEFEERYGADLARRVVRPRLWDATVFACGVGLSVLGAHGLVTGAVGMARALGLSEIMIGLTIVAFGTPSPEHVTTIVAGDAQLCRPTDSLCGSTPWIDPYPAFAQGLGTSRVKAGPIPFTQGRTSRTHVEPVDRGDSSGETRIRGVWQFAIGRTPLVHADHLHDDWRPHGQSRRGGA